MGSVGLTNEQYGRILELLNRLVAYEEEEERREDEARGVLGELRTEVEALATPGAQLADWLPHMYGSPGIVVDEGLARSSPCIRMMLKERPLVWSKGIVGALDEKQQALYCGEYIEKELTPAVKERIAAWHTATEVCKAEVESQEPGLDRMERWWGCMSRQASGGTG